MSDERWERMWELFHAARERPATERPAFLASACSADLALQKELEELLCEAAAPSAALDRGPLGTRARDPELGQQIGPYTLTRVLGEGGMGVVYEAKQSEPVHRRVALKLVRAGLDTREILARFEAEKDALSILEHAAIARVLDAGATEEGRPYFAMDLVRGRPITAFCDAQELDTSARLALFEIVCDAVQHAHRRGVIHRDLKPSNILVTMEGGRPHPKIIDFGIARAVDQQGRAATLFTELGRIVGTPEYMSPEQAGLTGDDVDTRTDVYALGVVLYELLVGAQPFDWRSLREAGYDEMRRIIREEDPPRPSRRLQTLGDTLTDVAHRRGTDPSNLRRSLSGDLDWVVMRCLEKDRERRYETPHDLVDDLRRYREDRPVEACPPTLRYRFGKFASRHRAGVVAAGTAAVAILLGVGVGAVGLLRALDAEKEALRSAKVAGEVSDFLTEIFEVSMPGERDADSVSARALLERGVEKISEGRVEDPEVRAQLLFTLGKVLVRIGMTEEGRRLLEEAEPLARAVHGDDAPEVVAIVNMRGAAAFNEGRFRDATDLYEKALSLHHRRTEGSDLGAAHILDNLAVVLGKQGRRGEARAILHRTLDLQDTPTGLDPGRLARLHQSIAVLDTEEGHFDEARQHLARALEILEEERGPDDPDIQYVVNSIGILEWQEGNYEAARPYFERSLASVRRTHGEEHPVTAALVANVGRLLMELEDYEESERLTREAIARAERASGPSHPDLATYLLNLAQILRRTGRADAAPGLYQRAMAIKEQAFGSESPELVRTLRSWAELMDELGDSGRAESLRRRADAIAAASGSR